MLKQMHKPLADPDFWHVPLAGVTVAHLVAEKLIKHARTGNSELYNGVLHLVKIANG